jgi:outer membrane protein TolC
VTERATRTSGSIAVHASEQARVQYQAGSATQLELLQAQRDAFQAEVTRIQGRRQPLERPRAAPLSAGQSMLPSP